MTNEQIERLRDVLLQRVETEFREGYAGIHETVQHYHDVYAWAEQRMARGVPVLWIETAHQ